MRSVRLDKDLDRRVEQAAGKLGVTVSEFIRRAVRQESDAVLAPSDGGEDWKSLIQGPHRDEWIRLLDGCVGVVSVGEPSYEELKADMARVLYEHNVRE